MTAEFNISRGVEVQDPSGFEKRYRRLLRRFLEGVDPEGVYPLAMNVVSPTVAVEPKDSRRRGIMEAEIHRELGIDSDTKPVREYTVTSHVSEPIRVGVYPTMQEELFLQEATFSDGEKEWMVGNGTIDAFEPIPDREDLQISEKYSLQELLQALAQCIERGMEDEAKIVAKAIKVKVDELREEKEQEATQQKSERPEVHIVFLSAKLREKTRKRAQYYKRMQRIHTQKHKV